MAAEGIYGFTTVYTKDETKAMGLDGDFSFVLETDGYVVQNNADIDSELETAQSTVEFSIEG